MDGMNWAERGLFSLMRKALWIGGIWLVVRYGVLHLPIVQEATAAIPANVTLPGGQMLGVGNLPLFIAHPVNTMSTTFQNYLNQMLGQLP